MLEHPGTEHGPLRWMHSCPIPRPRPALSTRLPELSFSNCRLVLFPPTQHSSRITEIEIYPHSRFFSSRSGSDHSHPPTVPMAKTPPAEGGRFSRQAFLQGAVAAAAPLLIVGGSGQQPALADNEIIEKMIADKIAAGWQEPEVTQRAFMDISIGDKPAGRLVINVSAASVLFASLFLGCANTTSIFVVWETKEEIKSATFL